MIDVVYAWLFDRSITIKNFICLANNVFKNQIVGDFSSF